MSERVVLDAAEFEVWVLVNEASVLAAGRYVLREREVGTPAVNKCSSRLRIKLIAVTRVENQHASAYKSVGLQDERGRNLQHRIPSDSIDVRFE